MRGSDLPANASSTSLTSLAYSSSSAAVLASSPSNGSILTTSTVLPSVTSSASLSSSTSYITTAVNTPDRLLTSSQPSQTPASTTSVSSTSGTSFAGLSAGSSSAASTSAGTATLASSTATNGLALPDAAKSASSSAISSVVSTSTTPAANHRAGTSPSSTSTAAQGTTTPVSPTESMVPTSTWSSSYNEYDAQGTTATTSSAQDTGSNPPQAPPTTAKAASSVPVSKSSSGTPPRTITKPPTAPKQIVSTSPSPPLVTITTQTTKSGHVIETTLTLESIGPESLVPVPTTGKASLHTSSSGSNNPLPLILGPILGVLALIALGVTFTRCRARRRSRNDILGEHSSDPSTSGERRAWTMIEEAPRVNSVTLGQRIASYRASSTYTPEHIATCISHAGESTQSSNGHLSDPFADSSDVVSSRTSMPPPSLHSDDSMSTEIAFISDASVSVDMDVRDPFSDSGSLQDGAGSSVSSLELRFVSPGAATNDDSSIRQHLSPSWHYDGQSAASSPREQDQDKDGEISPVSSHSGVLPSRLPKPFSLGRESARLRLHALLREARRS